MIVHECQQGDDTWWNLHHGRPTAGHASRIVTPKKWDYAAAAHGYICELIAGTYLPPMRSDFATCAMLNGLRIEPEARRFFTFSENVEVEEVGFITTDDGRYGCSPDAIVVGEPAGLEIKCPEPKQHVNYCLCGGVPPEYLPQIHFGLYVTGFDCWHFLSYCPPLPELLVRVERDEKTEQLGAHLEKFWGEYQKAKRKIEGQDKPAPTKVVSFGGEEVVMDHYEQSPF